MGRRETQRAMYMYWHIKFWSVARPRWALLNQLYLASSLNWCRVWSLCHVNFCLFLNAKPRNIDVTNVTAANAWHVASRVIRLFLRVPAWLSGDLLEGSRRPPLILVTGGDACDRERVCWLRGRLNDSAAHSRPTALWVEKAGNEGVKPLEHPCKKVLVIFDSHN